MEMLILVFALVTSVVGTVILLSCLVGRRAELVKAFNLQRQHQSNSGPANDDVPEEKVATVSGAN